MITLTRMYTPWGVIGEWDMPGFRCVTLERPWLGNARGQSCIPEGVYPMAMRQSPVVSRITRGRHPDGWEIQDVPERTFIMVHPGNWIENSDGCILVGKRVILERDRIMITDSQDTFDALMTAMGTRQDWDIDIRPFQASYP
jgi:hypothetical protein